LLNAAQGPSARLIVFSFLSDQHELVNGMVFILYGCSFHIAYVRCKQGFFSDKKIGFDDSFDVTKCLQQIEMPDLLHVCASEMSNLLLWKPW